MLRSNLFKLRHYEDISKSPFHNFNAACLCGDIVYCRAEKKTVSGGPNSSIMDMAPENKKQTGAEFLPVTLMICQVKLVYFVATMIIKPSGLRTLTCWQVLTSTFLFQNPITIAKPM